MDNAGYVTLTRQTGLLREMQGVANNLANMSTTGFRREGVIFSEYVRDIGPDAPSLSMATGRVREMDFAQGPIARAGGEFDLAIEGEGFFLVATTDGDRLTRNGAFLRSAGGEVVTAEGHALLDLGGAPLFAPPDARTIAVASDGTVSADGNPIGQIGLWMPADINDLTRADGVLFAAPGGVDPAPVTARILQGYLEGSNVNPVSEITRMIQVQRAYELGQGLMDREDERIRSVIRTFGR